MNQFTTTTAGCPDGTFYGAVARADGLIILMSDALPSRSKARTWAKEQITNGEADKAAAKLKR